NVTRGYRQSIAQKHWSNEPGLDITYRKVTNRPVRIRGRRVYLYLYGDADDLQGEGTLVWMGHVAGEPAVDDAGSARPARRARARPRGRGTRSPRAPRRRRRGGRGHAPARAGTRAARWRARSSTPTTISWSSA